MRHLLKLASLWLIAGSSKSLNVLRAVAHNFHGAWLRQVLEHDGDFLQQFYFAIEYCSTRRGAEKSIKSLFDQQQVGAQIA